MCGALKDGRTVETVNAAVGRETPAAPAGNYSQHSVRWERSQDAEVTGCAPLLPSPRGPGVLSSPFGHCTNFTTQLRQLLLLNGLPTCDPRPRAGSGIITTLVSLLENGNGARDVPSHSYYAVNAQEGGIDLSIQGGPSGDVLSVFSMLGVCTLPSGQRKALTVSIQRLACVMMTATNCPSPSDETN